MGVKMILMLLLVLFSLCRPGYASWTGPLEEVSGNWGREPGTFAIDYQDTHDIFPTAFAISSSGQIAISEDQVLKRVQLFKGGALERIIDTFAFDLVYVKGDLYVSGGGFRKYDSAGDLVWSKSEISFAALYATLDDRIVGYRRKENRYYLYSPTGELIKTSAARPLELGNVKEIPVSETQYKIEIQYPDKTYVLNAETPFIKYVRDANGYINAVNPGGVWRFDQCGRQIGELLMPKQGAEPAPVPGTGKYMNSAVEYGEPVVAPNGDVYAWKKTDFGYSILKWTWVDDPDTPPCPEKQGTAQGKPKAK